MEVKGHPVATDVPRSGEPRRVVAFCLGLLAAALGTGAVLLANGAPVPAPGPILILALVAALCVNRIALFPTEHASTAEAAVLLAAVVGFRDDAVFLGPLVVALLVGPLDAFHWGQRAFVRMAHNAGNRGLATLSASAAFVACRDAFGSSAIDAIEWCVIVVVAAASFVAVDIILSATLLRLLGEPMRAALRHLLEVDALTLPIAWYGGTIALLLGGIGWWASALALVPVAMVPELVIARAHWNTAVVRDVAALLAIVAVLCALAQAMSTPTVATVIALVVIGALAGMEFMIDRHSLLPPLVAIAVVGAIVERDHTEFAAALVATVAVTVSWWAAGRASRPHLFGVLAAALGASLVATEVAVATPRTLAGIALGSLLAGLGFAVIGVVAGRDRRRAGVAAVWAAPFIGAAVAWAQVWRTVPFGGAAVFVAAMAASLAGAVWWGAPSWRSRVLQHALGGRNPRWILPTMVALGLGAIVSAVVGATWFSVGLAESVTAMVAVGVRQWRFAPRARALSFVALLATSALLVAVVPQLLLAGTATGPLLVASLLAIVAFVARRPAAHLRRPWAAHEPAEVTRP